nr:hypothetical protein [Tanacetum cinerariifolium]
MHKAFLLPEESSHWQYKFPLPVKVVPTARRLEMPLPEVCTAIEEMMKKLPSSLYALLESTSSKLYEENSTQVPEGSENLNPTASAFNPPTDQMETLTV